MTPSSAVELTPEAQEAREAIPDKRTVALIETLEKPVRIEGVVSRARVEEQIESALALFLNEGKEQVESETETARGRGLSTGETGVAADETDIITGKRELSEELITYASFSENGERTILIMISDIDNARRLNNRLKDRSAANAKISGICNSAVRRISKLDGEITDENPLSSRLKTIRDDILSELGEMEITENELSERYKESLIKELGEAEARSQIAKNDSIAKMLEGSISMGVVVVGEEDIIAIAKKLTARGVEQSDLTKAIKSELLARADKALKIAKGQEQLLTEEDVVVSGEKSTFAVSRIEQDPENPEKRKEIVSLQKAEGIFQGSIEFGEIEKRAKVVYEIEEDEKIEEIELKKVEGHVEEEDRKKDMEDEAFGVYKAEYLKEVITSFEDGAAVVPFEVGFSALNVLLGYAEADKILLAMANELSTQFGKESGFKIIKAGTIMVLVGPKRTEEDIQEKCSQTAGNLLEKIKIVREAGKESLHDFLTSTGARTHGTTGFFFEHAEVGTDEEGNLQVEKYVSERKEIPSIMFE